MARGGALIGALRVSLGLDSAEFEAGTKRAKATAKRDAIEIQKTFTSLKTTALAAFAALGGAELVAASKRALDYSDAIVDLADRTGATTKVIQQFRYAAQMSGSDVGTADAAIEKFTRSLGLAQSGSQTQAKLFRELGVTSGDFETAFRQTLDGLERLPTVSQRNATALQIFGKSAGTLTTLMGQGTKGFDEMAAAANRLGIVIEDRVLREAGAVNDRLDTMKGILDAKFAASVDQNANALAGLADGFIQVADGAFKAMGAIQGWNEIRKREGLGAALWATGDEALQMTTRQGRANRAEANARRAEANVGEQQRIYRETGGRAGSPTQAKKEAQRLRAEAGRVYQEELKGLLDDRRTAREAAARRRMQGGLPAPTERAKPSSLPKLHRSKQSENLDRYNEELQRMIGDELRVRQQLSNDTAERGLIEQQLIDLETEAFNKAVNRRFADGELDEQQAIRLKAGNKYIALAQGDLARARTSDELAREENDLRLATLDNAERMLRLELANARTVEQRRAIELKLVDYAYERERIALNQIVQSEQASKADKQRAGIALAELPRQQTMERQNIQRANLGSLAEFMDKLPRTAGEVQQAYEQIAAEGLGSLTDGLAEAMAGARDLGDVFKNVANQIIADLIRIQIQKVLTGALSKALGGHDGRRGPGYRGCVGRRAKLPRQLLSAILAWLRQGGQLHRAGCARHRYERAGDRRHTPRPRFGWRAHRRDARRTQGHGRATGCRRGANVRASRDRDQRQRVSADGAGEQQGSGVPRDAADRIGTRYGSARRFAGNLDPRPYQSDRYGRCRHA